MSDVVELILAEHEKIRDHLGTLSQAGGTLDFPAATPAAGRSLAALLEPHTQAEQEIVHPVLWGLSAEITRSVLTAVADHDDIREIALETHLQPAGCTAWRQAVSALHRVIIRHLAWEEQVLLPTLCRSTSPAARDKLGRQWAAYTAAHAADALDLVFPVAWPGPGEGRR